MYFCCVNLEMHLILLSIHLYCWWQSTIHNFCQTSMLWYLKSNHVNLLQGLVYYLLPFATESLRCMHFMSPLTFIHNPVLWLELMARHGCEIASAPDFAFRLVAQKWMGAKHKRNVLSTLNLSCIRTLMSASEPVRSDTEELFVTTFSP